MPVLVSKTRFADDPVLFAATLIAPVTVMRLLETNERPEPLARLIAPSARMPLLAPAAVLFAVTESCEPAPVSVIAPRLAMVVAVAPVALIVMPVLADSAPESETGKAVELVVLLIEMAPRLEVIAPVPETPNWELAVCAELFVMVTPVAPEISALTARPATLAVPKVAVERLLRITAPLVEVSAEVTKRFACDKAEVDATALIRKSP